MSYPTGNAKLIEWVEEIAKLTTPDRIHWCDGTAQEYDDLCQLLVDNGTFQKLSDANFRLNDLHEQLNKANRKNELVEIHAQEPGIVQSIAKVSVGSVLAPGQPFMTVVSTANGLEIEANIPGADSGFVKTGDEVAIKFDTLPFATYGMYHGLVKIISPDAFTPQREMVNPTGAMPAESNEPYYRSVIDLTKSELHNLPVGFELVPGMPVVTDIKVGERSVLSYFLQKIVPIFKEGLREP